MKCWICGDEGTTREHKTKASDLRALFPIVTQKSPLFLHTDQKTNQKVGSIKADKFKFDALICANCNNSRTSSYDRAWECLSNFLRGRRPLIKKGDIISLHQVFPGSVTSSMLDVHIYFVKLFGCAIIEHREPIDIAPFAEAILQHKPHPNVYLSFWPDLEMGTGLSNMETDNVDGKCVYATWFYIVEPISVNVMYAAPNECRQGLIHAWHPRNTSMHLQIGGY